MTYLPLRLPPGADLRRALEAHARATGASAFVAAGIGSLTGAVIRMAAAEQETAFSGPFEILGLSGTLSADGAHLHMSVSDETGRVVGGHVCYGNIVRTTAEVLLVVLDEWQLSRAPDPQTGHPELQIRRSGTGPDAG